MKSISGVAAMLLSGVLFAVPAWAVVPSFDYSASSTIDLTTLRFSGILTTYTQFHQFSQVLVKNPDSFAGAAPQQEFAQNSGPTTVEQNVSTSLEGVGTASAFQDASRMTASIHFAGPFFVTSNVYQFGNLVAQETGALTVTVQYTMTHSGLPTDLTTFTTTGGPVLSVGNDLDSKQNVFVNGIQSGILSVTRFFTQGEQVVFSLSTDQNAHAVPVPPMVWPTVIGMIGLEVVVAWRREHAA